MDSEAICRDVGSIDDSLGLAVIRGDFVVEWANKKHLERWPGLIGNVCYKYVNGFSRPCEWCPVQETHRDHRIHERLVCSPKGNDVEYSTIISVPASGPNEEPGNVVEIVFDNTKAKKEDYGRRGVKYRFFADFCNALEGLSSESYIADFLLVGAVWKNCLGFSKADIYVLEESTDVSDLKVCERRTIESSLSLDDVLRGFTTSLSRDDLTSLRGRLKSRCIHWTNFDAMDLPVMSQLLAESHQVDVRVCERLLKAPQRTFRLTSKAVATRIAGPQEVYLLVPQMVGTGHDLVTDQALLDVGVYASVAERAIRDRKLAARVDSVIEKCGDFFDTIQQDAGAFVFGASVVTSFAHDLKESCRSLRGNIYQIWSKHDKAHQEELASAHDAVTRELDFIQGCMNRAIDVARMDRIEEKDFAQTDVHALIREAALSFARLFKDNKIHFTFSPKTDDGSLVCDGLLVKQLLSNLIANACASLAGARHRRRTLVIETNRSDVTFSIVVRDNGLGIDPAIKGKIWEPFFSTKRRGRGTGLGLTICRRIAQDIHKGKIEVESRHGYGATFIVLLPIKSSPV